MARTLRIWAINRRGKNLVRNLQYGPRTRLVGGMYKQKHKLMHFLSIIFLSNCYHSQIQVRGQVSFCESIVWFMGLQIHVIYKENKDIFHSGLYNVYCVCVEFINLQSVI